MKKSEAVGQMTGKPDRRHCEKLNDRRLTQLQRQISGGGICSDLVVFHPLSSTNQSEVWGASSLLALALARLQKPLPMRKRGQADTSYTTTRQDNASNGCSNHLFECGSATESQKFALLPTNV